MSTPIVSDAAGFKLERTDLNAVRANLYFGFAVLAVGVLLGLDQAYNYAGVDLVRHYPVINSYYQGLTIHGVFNALVLTTAFANGFIVLTTARGLGRRLPGALVHAALWTMLAGAVLAAWAMFTGRATVLYTFYPPLQAHWSFYLGLALVVISTWITSAAQLVALRGWRRDNPGRRVPLLAFMSIATYVMWDIASVGIAIEVVALLLPWSLGIVPGTEWAAYYAEYPFAQVPDDDPLYALVPELTELADRGVPVVSEPTFGKWSHALAAIVGETPQLTLAGVATDCCVLTTALAAADAGATVRVASELCAGSSLDNHARALAAMALYAPQITVL